MMDKLCHNSNSSYINQDEFSFISQYFAKLNPNFNAQAQAMGLTLGIGDDAAIVNMQGHYALTTDTLVEKVHFFSHLDPKILGARSLEVNFSDLYAMGAIPQFVLLSLNIPKAYQLPHILKTQSDFWERFSQGFANCLSKHNCALIGGNITSMPQGLDKSLSPLCISITAIGKSVSSDNYLERGHIQDQDIIALTNYIGANALFVEANYKKLIHKLNVQEQRAFEHFVYQYDARMQKIASFLAQNAHAAIDVSDGLLGDLSHMLIRSNCKALINIDNLPIDNTTQYWAQKLGIDKYRLLHLALNNGGDYNLIFTLTQDKFKALKQYLAQEQDLQGFNISAIGMAYKNIDKVQSLNQESLKTNIDLINLTNAQGENLDQSLRNILLGESFNHFA